MMSQEITDEFVASLSRRHRWSATGVSDYPPRDPLVGQSRFFRRFKNFLHTVDHDHDHFAHVFAVEAGWGRGKSRLGHELSAQINDCSCGWYVRDKQGYLINQELFDAQAKEKYLALYIRYSQVASEYQNSDNWFAYGLYQALLPLATGRYDDSIQSEIAKQAAARLIPLGFDQNRLAQCLDLEKDYSEEELYEDSGLLVSLVQAAYEYLQTFGIEYMLVVLDELETVAEAATFGLEDEQDTRLDGQAIRLIGKAIKEEDPRRKLPWLRYVALCSPLLGQQLREIQSVARRFELVELEHNAFADVSDYVQCLENEGKLGFTYPRGLVQAAYAMSGANFGWFNVIMANVDSVLERFVQAGQEIPDVGRVFEEVLDSSGRVAKHVLDPEAVEGIQTTDQDMLFQCRKLLFGQLPVPLSECPEREILLNLKNEDQEPIAALYHKVTVDRTACWHALEQARFRRVQEEWVHPLVEQPLSLETLLANLRTFSIQEIDKDNNPDLLLAPLSKGEFKHLLSLLYDHPAIDMAADALWSSVIGHEADLPSDQATHIGPSVAMLLRLDLRYRNVRQNSMIFREPEYNDQHKKAMDNLIQQSRNRPELRLKARLTGIMRLIDNNWQYNEPLQPNKAGKNQEQLIILTEPRGTGPGQRGGLVSLQTLYLHPDGKAWLAWVSNKEELDQLHIHVTSSRGDNGRVPVVVFTASAHLQEIYNREGETSTLGDNILLCYLNPSEVDQVERIGLDRDEWQGFEISLDALTAKFKHKLRALEEIIRQAIDTWRHRLDQRGLIAWPLKISGKITKDERFKLFEGWQLMTIQEPELDTLFDIHSRHGVDTEALSSLLQRLAVPNKVLSQGFSPQEQAKLFTDLDNPQQAQAQLPLFLARIASPTTEHQWTLERAKQEWYWGYAGQENIRAKNVFEDWMWWAGQLYLLEPAQNTGQKGTWTSYPRARLEHAITQAKNWFYGDGDQDYSARVDMLGRVFGLGRIDELFAPVGRASLGTQTVEAKEKLEQAEQTVQSLKNEEESLAEYSWPEVQRALPWIVQQRKNIITLVDAVRPLELGTVSLSSVHTLQLEDTSTSLYLRVEQACLFAQFVEQAGARISNRILELIAEMETDCEELTYFPKALFSQSLRTVSNIIRGALEQDTRTETSKTEGQAGSDTLLHYLRSLKLEKAHERIQILAQEAGMNLHSEHQEPFSEVKGYIVSSYRDAKSRYKQTSNYLQGLKEQCQQLSHILEPLPADYEHPDQPQTLVQQEQKLENIADAFQNMSEDAEEERRHLREAMRKGQFQDIQPVPERLIHPVHKQLHPIDGALKKISNYVKQYKESQLRKANDLLPALRPLFQAAGQEVPDALSFDQVQDFTLNESILLAEETAKQWQEQANRLLGGTGVDFDTWQDIAVAINQGQEPNLDPEQREKLVQQKILRIRLSFATE